MTTRRLTLDFVSPRTSGTFNIVFIPQLASAVAEVVLEDKYVFKVNYADNTVDGTANAYIELPVSDNAEQSILYDFEFPRWVNKSQGYFAIKSGATTSLAAAMAAGVVLTDTVQSYIDNQFHDIDGGNASSSYTDTIDGGSA